MNRIFVSSVGTISCLGDSVEKFWEGINIPKPRYDLFKLPTDLPKNIDTRIARRMDRFSRLALSVSKLTIDDGYFQQSNIDRTRIGTVFNTAYGPINSTIKFIRQIDQDGLDMVSPTVFTSTVHNSAIGHTCLNLNLKGASTMLLGSNGIAYASDLLKSNKADAILCVGVEEYCESLDESYQQKEYITNDQSYLCRPCDMERSGTRITEGAGALLLENEHSYQKNPQSKLSEIMGYASLISASNPIKDSEKIRMQDFSEVMNAALKHASLPIEEIDGIMMAAGGGKHTDMMEAQAIHQIFGSRATSIPVASIKGATGETMGSSFVLNTIAGSLALVKNVMPLTSGCESPDPRLNLDVVHCKVRPGYYRYILVNGFDVSGCLYSLVLGSVRR
ncbi:beta-ketoacyl synthase N-terminal-like domain-containing protein [Paenibacillus alvei]|uniref:beta-ketoacyl synthase N-terminal-like domain-containing protein n=1 Tax=Paenibacillus alvei TaxID=44250 RepID=UPI000386488B|nr:beta-ketoacyl synthase N-terminal-like domain-containing protein [Paenibacillus alvei]EPY14032.1 3-oxoacyl-(acyl-carrier-protein) synthase II [Paenibacillus alvei A6-6i-x]